MEPDDIRVNLELHLLVQEALHAAGAEELKNFDPINNKRPQEIKRGLVALRLKVIADYQAKKESNALPNDS
jgi:hypothetical protein